ncbi:hypothetical protein Ddc_22099 [Ditylenchus destructor]|nr:hypothetical protein Ddc_22099 [Ditylenchus destructor]
MVVCFGVVSGHAPGRISTSHSLRLERHQPGQRQRQPSGGRAGSEDLRRRAGEVKGFDLARSDWPATSWSPGTAASTSTATTPPRRTAR